MPRWPDAVLPRMTQNMGPLAGTAHTIDGPNRSSSTSRAVLRSLYWSDMNSATPSMAQSIRPVIFFNIYTYMILFLSFNIYMILFLLFIWIYFVVFNFI